MLDCARRFYTITFLQTTIQQMALYGFNQLHLHLSDNEALSIESSTVPGAVSSSHYTKAQMSALVSYAAGYGIEIIPEIDMPGHMGAILASAGGYRSEEHTSELQSLRHLVCRLLLEKKKTE